MRLDVDHRYGPLFLVLCSVLLGGWQAQVRIDYDAGIHQEEDAASAEERYVPISRAPALEGVLIVKFKSDVAAGVGKTGRAVSGIASFDQLAQQIQSTGLRQLFPAQSFAAFSSKVGQSDVSADQVQSLQRIYELRFDGDLPPFMAAALLSDDPNIEYVEPRYLYTITGFLADAPAPRTVVGKIEPNDPQFSEMSHLSHVSMPQAWDLVKAGEGDVIISVVDAGTDWRHQDLVSNIWRNPGEFEGNGIDDDNNGFVDDVRGWNFANKTGDPTGLGATEANATHGTLVAGIASAVTNNEEGIAGASWNATLMPVNAGCASTDSAVCYGFEGMLYAIMEGADIINASWGGPDSFLGREVVGMALDMGVLLVASAGNGTGDPASGVNVDENLSYPAAYNRVLSVGATQKRSDEKADFSNFGIGVDVFAPGVTLNSTTPDDAYTTLASGTSFSTPMVAGLAALIKTMHPEWTFDQVREQIRVTSDPIDGANAGELQGLLGKGRINAFRALTDQSLPSLRIRRFEIIDSGNDGVIQSGESVIVNVDVINYLAETKNISLALSIDDADVVIQNGAQSIASIASGGTETVQFSFSFSNDVPKDHEMNFRLDIVGANYSDASLIRLTANRATHDTGVLQMSLTDEGNIGWAGFQEESEGRGFQYLGVNWLFEGGVLIGNSENKISDSIRNTEDNMQDEDLRRPEGAFFGILSSPVVSENGLVILDDASAAAPLGIKVHQESYADSKDENNDFIILRYVVSHADPQASVDIQNLHISLFTDWDLTSSSDYARFDEEKRMGIVQPSAEDPIILFATSLLNEDVSFSYRSIDNEEIFDSRSGGNGFTNAEKWAFMTDGVQVEEVNNTDVSTMVTAGPFHLLPGGSVEAAFALMAARNEEELARFSDQAQTFWNKFLSVLPPYPVGVEDDEVPAGVFSLAAPYPNPVRSKATIGYTLPAAGSVQLVMYDILGREVKTLVNAIRPAGRHTVQWNGRNHNDELVSNGVYFYRLRAATAQANYTSTRKMVFVH